ncbi:MAG: acetylornithine deacetylase [Phycisphaerales bacterium]|nr:acetylornithine deacetylase [Phycisphaerales bacterium]
MDASHLKDLLAELIAFDTTSDRSNFALMDMVQDRLAACGAACHRIPMDGGEKVNLLAIKGTPREDRRGLILCGHVDTVPADAARWSSDPWTLTSKEDRWTARGSCDMKGFVAIAIAAMEQCDPAAAPLALLLTCDEEVGSLGARQVAEAELPMPVPRSVIIGEPTSLEVVRLHKGHISLSLHIEGVSAHTGSPHLGSNAVEAAARVVVALADLGSVMASERTPDSEHFTSEAAFPILTVASAHGGSAINVVPEGCDLGIGLRLLPDQSPAKELDRIRAVIDASCSDPWTLEERGDNPAMSTGADAEVHRWLCEETGQNRSMGVSYGTDGGYLSRAGFECVLYGPGDIGVAHKPDEFVPIAEVEQCAATIVSAVQHFCGGSA